MTVYMYIRDIKHLPTHFSLVGTPHDGVPIQEVVTVSLSLTVLYVFLATAGIVFAVVCLIFTIMFRNKR